MSKRSINVDKLVEGLSYMVRERFRVMDEYRKLNYYHPRIKQYEDECDLLIGIVGAIESAVSD